MNVLIVGFDKQPLSQYIPREFLLIDDGPFIDSFNLPRHRVFDVSRHTFNPLKDIDYRSACEFVDVLKAVFFEGENTLTKATFEYQLLEALRHKPKRLDTLIRHTKDTQYAYQKIQRILMSEVLKGVLNGSNNFSLTGTIVARLDRAILGDFDCFVLGNLLISQYQGTVILPDFGFYATPAHARLIRQNRLVAGINSFDEVPKLKRHLLLIKQKIASSCTADDAETLAQYKGLIPGVKNHTDFIADATGG